MEQIKKQDTLEKEISKEYGFSRRFPMNSKELFSTRNSNSSYATRRIRYEMALFEK